MGGAESRPERALPRHPARRGQEWANRGRTALTPRESAFLAASVRDEERAHRSVRRRNRQLYWLSVGLTVLLLLVSGIATGGELQRRNTTARMLAAEAEAVAATDTGTAIRRSLEAYHAYDTPETRSTVLSLAGHPNNHGELRQSGTSALAFSPDGAVLATGGQGELALWSHRTRIAELGSPQETAAYSALGFAPDGKRLAAGRENGQIEVWDTTGRVRIAATSGTGARITDVEFTGQILAVARGTTVELWDTALRQRTGELPGGFGTVWELALSPDGRTLALATDNGIVLWDLGTNTRLPELPQPRGPVNEVAFSPDGSRIAAARPDLSLSMWELTGSRRTTGFPGVTVPVSGLAFAPDGRTLLSASFDNTVTLWDGDRPGQRRTLLATEPGGLTDIAASRDGSIAAMSRDAILRWEMARLPLAAPESSAPITYTPDGSALVGAADGTLVEWRGNGAAGGVPLGRAVNAVFSRDRTKLALNSGNTVSVWDVVRRTKEAEWAVPEAHAIALSADGAQLAVADTEGTRIWNVAQRRPVTSLKGYPGRPSALDLSPDGRRLAAGGEGDVLMVWDVASGQRVAEEADTWGLPTFAPDGKHLAVFGYSGATLWDPENSSRGISGFTRLGRGMLADSSPATTAFSPDGRFLAAAGENNTVVLFDVVNGGPWATLTGHTGPVHSLAWNHDGSRLATAGGDGTIIEWSTAPDQAISQLCQMLAEDFPNHDQPRVTTCTR
ncbi:WD40 repeat domain-containing protein [Saccharopolyspora spinosporotrichia]